MSRPAVITFFGTGSQYNLSRNQSGIGLSLCSKRGRLENWLFDCGDGTLRQMIHFDELFNRMLLNKIFITHLHVDHSSGVPALLSAISTMHSDKPFTVDVYGPPHLCAYLLPALYYSQTQTVSHMRFHELLPPESVQEDLSQFSINGVEIDAIYPDEDGFWTCFANEDGCMRAGSLQHGIDCRGYCYNQYLDDNCNGRKTRKITIFGDTFDSESMKPLVMNSDVLVHEASFGPIITDIDRKYLSNINEWKSLQTQLLEEERNMKKWMNIKEKAKKWNHSTLDMVGAYASSIHAKNLILTHIGGRYDAKSPKSIRNIQYLLEQQARLYFKGHLEVAYDGFQFVL